jgi:hypothetical protein
LLGGDAIIPDACSEGTFSVDNCSGKWCGKEKKRMRLKFFSGGEIKLTVSFYLPSERGAARAVSNNINGCAEVKRSDVFKLQSIGGSFNSNPATCVVAPHVAAAVCCWPR